MAKWRSRTTEQISISVVQAHGAQVDTKLQRTVFTANIKTRTELQNELRVKRKSVLLRKTLQAKDSVCTHP